MAWIDPRYLEHQAKRFIRPNWERYMRPDWRDRKYWVGEPPDNPFGLPNARRPIGKAAPLLDHWAEQEAIERERLALQRRLNALRLELATFKHDLLLRRKAYNPQQPRVPAGNPTGGRWTDDASSSGSFDFSAARRLGSRPHGHHFIPHGLYAKMPLSEEARRVFDEAKTGRLQSQRHGRSKDHDVYNEAVKQKLDAFLSERKIKPEEMTADQADAFVKEVIGSRDPRIRDFNVRIYRRELLYLLRRAPRRE